MGKVGGKKPEKMQGPNLFEQNEVFTGGKIGPCGAKLALLKWIKENRPEYSQSKKAMNYKEKQ